jgi:hypothetical protein
MPSAHVKPVTLSKLDDWSRVYRFDFKDSFVEFGAPTPPAIVGAPTVTADPGLTVTYVSTVGAAVNVRIAGGTVGESYNVLVAVVLTSGDELSIPAVVTVLVPGPGGIAQQTLGKLPGWGRHYLFPFGKVFAEFNATPPPSIVGTPAFSCTPAHDGSTLSGSTVVSGSSVVVFITGGNAGQTYPVRCTVTTSAGDTLSIPGAIAD